MHRQWTPSEAAVAESPAKARQRRTRTGCLECRVRRRKCGEEKPRCLRCVNRNSNCEYPSGLKFLDKNAVTVSAPSSPKRASSSRYSRLRFLEPGSLNARPRKAISSNPVISSNGPDTSVTTISVDAASTTGSPTRQGTRDSQDYSVADDHAPVSSWVLTAKSAGVSAGVEINAGFDGSPGISSESYETALQGLLSLGADGADTNFQPPATPAGGNPYEDMALRGTGASPFVQEQGYQDPARLLTSPASHVVQVVDLGSDQSDSSREHVLGLFRHYRYEIAPWLDICDMTQTFGLSIPRMGLESPPIMRAILELSEASLEASSSTRKDASKSNQSAHNIPRVEEASHVICLLSMALTEARHCFSRTRSSPPWPNYLHGVPNLSLIESVNLDQKLRYHVLGLLLRLELAAALGYSGTVRPHYQLAFEPLMMDHRPNRADMIFRAALKPLLLCAEAVNFCSSPSAPPSPSSVADRTPRPSPAHRWRVIAGELGGWYLNRPQEFQPIIELDLDSEDDEHLFPTVLFTNGAAILANQLYHTAMLLLLQHKPRTIALEPKKSPSLSPLWHAQRICGIALNNDRRECWDICLVSSLYVAAKGMTYEPQQKEVRQRLDTVRALTGWDTEYFACELGNAWGGGPRG